MGASARSLLGLRDWRVHIPDEVLLRRFGLVRVVGGAAYTAVVIWLLAVFGRALWPLALGVPVLFAVTAAYVRWSEHYPRAAVAFSLAADALVLAAAVAVAGGAGHGLVMLYAIVVVSAGLLLGQSAAIVFTGLAVLLALAQFALEEIAGLQPVLVPPPDLGSRLVILTVSLVGLLSVGFLSSIYAGRLHELIALAGVEAEAARRSGRRRRSFVEQTVLDAREPLGQIEAIADSLAGEQASEARDQLAARLRVLAAQLDARIETLGQAGALGAAESRPQPVLLASVVSDCLTALDQRLEAHRLEVDVPPLKALGDRRSIRRAVLSVLENVADHTPGGTRVHITAVAAAGQAVVVVTDDGPGIPGEPAQRLWEAAGGGRAHVGLPLVRELCRAMGGDARYEPSPSGGARFMLAFRLGPRAAPSDDDRPAGRESAAGR